MEPQRCRQLGEASRVARLATTRPDGRVDLVPIVFAFHGDDLVFAVDHKPKSTQRLQRLTNIATNPQVTALFDRYDDDWSQLWWVRMRGEAREVDGAAATPAVDALVAKYDHYRQTRPTGPVVTITPTAWHGWSAQ